MAFVLEEAIPVLERTPATLRAWLSGLDDAWLTADEGPGTWSVIGVLGHLCHGEEADWIPRARTILEEGETHPFEPFDREAQNTLYGDWTATELIDRFENLRASSLGTLRSWELRPEQFALTGTHPEFGRVTLGQLLATWVAHDLTHVRQIARILAHRYDAAVGPWKTYLGVLTDRRADG